MPTVTIRIPSSSKDTLDAIQELEGTKTHAKTINFLIDFYLSKDRSKAHIEVDEEFENLSKEIKRLYLLHVPIEYISLAIKDKVSNKCTALLLEKFIVKQKYYDKS